MFLTVTDFDIAKYFTAHTKYKVLIYGMYLYLDYIYVVYT